MRKAFNCYAAGNVKSGRTEINLIDFGIEKTGVGQWLFSDCLDFDLEKWRYERPIDHSTGLPMLLEITSNYSAELKQMSISVKKDGKLFDCRGFTIALNYEDIESEFIEDELLNGEAE